MTHYGSCDDREIRAEAEIRKILRLSGYHSGDFSGFRQ